MFPQTWKIFPLNEGKKTPFDRWKEICTDDKSIIKKWKQIYPRANWGIATGPSGLLVIDVDPEGLSWWENFLAEDDDFCQIVNRTYQVQTPRGGLHIYFRGEARTTASFLAKGVDTRGVGGYVVAAGGHIAPYGENSGGSYEVINGLPDVIETLPENLKILLEKKNNNVISSELITVTGEKDLSINIDWAISLLEGYVSDGRVSIQGQGGNNLAYQVSASILDKGISPSMTLELMLKHWNAACNPPWEMYELETIINNATNYGEETRQGAKGFQKGEEVFNSFQGIIFDEEPEEQETSQDFPLMLIDDLKDQLKPPSWLIPNYLPDQGAGIIYGGRSSYKSFIVMDMALRIATGTCGMWDGPQQPCPVIYFAGEGLSDFAHNRVQAWKMENNIETKPLLYSYRDGVPEFLNQKLWEAFRDKVKALKIKPALIVIDTIALLSRGLDEDNNSKVSEVTSFMLELGRYFECFVLGIHHSGKDLEKGARGASAWEANVDTVLHAKAAPHGMSMRVTKQRGGYYDPSEWFHFSADKVEHAGIQSAIMKPMQQQVFDAEAQERVEVRNAWAEREEVKRIILEIGSPVSLDILAREIAENYDVKVGNVKKVLKKSLWLTDLYDINDNWSVQEYDL